MARHGENIRKRKDGRWEGRYSVYIKEKKKKVYHSVYGKSYEEVKEKLIINKMLSTESSLNNGSNHHSYYRNVKFSDAAEAWLMEISMVRKISTYVKYRFIYDKYLALVLRDHKVTDIDSTIIERNISKCTSESVQKSIYCVLNQI